MKRNKIRLIFVMTITIITLIITFSNSVLAYQEDYDRYNRTTTSYSYEEEKLENDIKEKYDYIIDLYEINMKVNENNTFDIQERITVNFNRPRHGIIRKIPIKNVVNRLDGSQSINRAKITDIHVNESYSQSTENEYKILKIGNANETITGNKSYIIKYKYNIGKDPLIDKDELYFNLIGNQWDTIINKVKFRIEMPKKFDERLLGLSSGFETETDTENVKYLLEGNTIKGQTVSKLLPGEGVTIRLTLPEGYFKGNNITLDTYTVVISTICISLVLIAFNMWHRYGKDYKKVETVEFYPPDGYNSAEINFLYNGKVDKKGILSLLIYLANKGYIKIEETKGDGILDGSETFKIRKIKEYDGNNKYEKMFMDGLFIKKETSGVDIDKANKIIEEAKKHGEDISFREALEMTDSSYEKSKEVVTEEDLKGEFYKTIRKIQYEMNDKSNKDKVVDPVSKSKKKWILLMEYFIFILISIMPIMTSGVSENIVSSIIILAFQLIGLTVLIGTIISQIGILKIFGIIWGLAFGGIPWAATVLPAIGNNSSYLVTTIIGIISITILTVLFKIMPKRTREASEIIARIDGFKNFLETSEKEELESMVLKQPEYFYNILAYTYALGISDKWIKKFETITIEDPDWYRGDVHFNFNQFNNFLDDSSSIGSSYYSSGGSSYSGGSSSSSSGGGSSGGGSGGGGGSSW